MTSSIFCELSNVSDDDIFSSNLPIFVAAPTLEVAIPAISTGVAAPAANKFNYTIKIDLKKTDIAFNSFISVRLNISLVLYVATEQKF